MADAPQFKYTIEQVVAKHIELSATIAQLEGSVKDKVNALKEQQLKLETYMQLFLNTTGQDSAKTPAGTVYQQLSEQVRLDGAGGWEAFEAWMIANRATDMLDKRVNKTAVLEYKKANNGQLPPGIKYDAFRKVHVRRPSSK